MKKVRKVALERISFTGVPLLGTLNATGEKILVFHTGQVNGKYLQQFMIFYDFNGKFIEAQDRYQEIKV